MPAPLRIELQAGQILFREGDPPDTAYLIERGDIEVRARQRGREVVLSLLGPGDLVGEMAVIDDSPRTATAVALSEAVLFPIDRSQIAERLAATDPIVRSLLEGQLKRYRGALAALQGQPQAASAPLTTSERLGVSKIRLESQLREALASKSLELGLQPLLDVDRHRIAGYEALVRWHHPERGPISPSEFVALAEETSLIVPVGEYVMDAACEAVARLVARGDANPFVAVNVSARQLSHPGLVERIVTRADAARLPRGSIKLEITESQVLDYDLVGEVIDLCHGHGIKVALDDFGTGYAHLAHLHRLEFDVIKIDQAFSRQMLGDPRAMAVVEAIVQLGRALQAEIVVEGVETAAQLESLRRLGCHYAQGYFIGRPRALEELLEAPARAPGER